MHKTLDYMHAKHSLTTSYFQQKNTYKDDKIKKSWKNHENLNELQNAWYLYTTQK